MGAALLSRKAQMFLLRCLCPAVDGALRASCLRSPLHHEPVAELERKQGLFGREVRSSLDKSSSWAGGPACSWEIPEQSGRLWNQHCSRGTTDLTPFLTLWRQAITSQRDVGGHSGLKGPERGPAASAIPGQCDVSCWMDTGCQHAWAGPERSLTGSHVTCDAPGPLWPLSWGL